MVGGQEGKVADYQVLAGTYYYYQCWSCISHIFWYV